MGNYYDGFLGQQMKNGSQGCVEGVGLMGAGTSPFLANEYNNGVVNVDNLINDAKNNNIPIIAYDPSQVSFGDTVVYDGDKHVVLSDGNGGYYGNSTSQNQLVHGGDINEMSDEQGKMTPTQIIKTGPNYAGKNGDFTYSANDANGTPFLKLNANIRTSDLKEPFDTAGIMSILGRQNVQPFGVRAYRDYLLQPDYNLQLMGVDKDIADQLQPVATSIMDKREQSLKDQVGVETQEDQMRKAVQVAQMINASNNVDNRRGYSSLAGLAGISIPDGADQFVSSQALLQNMVDQINNERQFRLKRDEDNMQQKQFEENMTFEKDKFNKQLELEKAKEAAQAARYSGGYGGGGGGRGGSGGAKLSDFNTMIELSDKFEKDHPGEYNPYKQWIKNEYQALDQVYDPKDMTDGQFNNYNQAMSNATRLLSDQVVNGDNGGDKETKEAMEAVFRQKYGDLADNIIDDVSWSQFGY